MTPQYLRKSTKNAGRSRKRRRNPEEGGLSRILEQGLVARWILGIFIFGLSVVIISWRGVPFDLPAEGEISNQNVVSTIDFSFKDGAKTGLAVTAAVSRQPFAYLSNHNLLKKKIDSLSEFLKLVGEGKAPDRDSENFSCFSLISPEQISRLSAADPADLERITAALLEKVYQRGILPPEVKKTLTNAGQQEIILVDERNGEEKLRTISSLLTPAQARSIIEQSARDLYPGRRPIQEASAALLGGLLEANLEFDGAKTEALKNQARKKVAPVMTEVSKGERIIRQGEIVKPGHIEKLRAYQEELFKLRPPISRLYYLLGTALLVLLLLLISVYFLERYHRSIIRSNSTLLLLSAIVVMVLVLARLLHHLFWYSSPSMLEFIRYISPVAVGSILICLLLGARVAVFITLILSLLTAMILSHNLGYLLVSVVGGLAGIFSIGGARKRIELLRAGSVVAGVSFLAVLGLGALEGLNIGVYLKQGTGSALGAIGSVFVALVALGILESSFRISSDIGLLELSDLNHPLLRRMMIRAPGTYHHSLMVATLAEGAAEEVGGNPLLARVGAYFHDIGKIVKPEYFSENEPPGRSRHDKLIPSMSSLILISHIKEGVNLARQHRLDRRIVGIIQQHHGTSLISYFYDRAERSRQMKFDVMEKDYRYPGPLPSSPEAAIVMMADAVEAASVSLERPTPSHLESMVQAIIQERFLDSQLDESGLTLNHIKKIRETFLRLLSARFHARVKYPEINSRKKNAG